MKSSTSCWVNVLIFHIKNNHRCICARTVYDDLNANEYVLGFYEIPNIKSETILAVVKDVLIRLQFPLLFVAGKPTMGQAIRLE